MRATSTSTIRREEKGKPRHSDSGHDGDQEWDGGQELDDGQELDGEQDGGQVLMAGYQAAR